MSNDTLIKFKEAVDEEIKSYEAMEELYKLKQAILVQGKSDVLWDVDAKIVDRMKTIRTLNSKRQEVGKYLGSENITMSEAIEKAQAMNDVIAENFRNQQKKLHVLTESISLYEQTNMDLIKHGLIMTGKSLDLIVNSLLPPSNQYGKDGKKVRDNKIRISSVVEEA